MKVLAGLLGPVIDDNEDDEGTASQGLLSSPNTPQRLPTGLLGYDGVTQQLAMDELRNRQESTAQLDDFPMRSNRVASGAVNDNDGIPLSTVPTSNQAGVGRPMRQAPGLDPSIPEVQNADGFWTPPYGGNAHPITAYNGNEILAGQGTPVDYSSASINPENKVISIRMRVNYPTPSMFNPTTGSSTPEEYARYVNLVNKGIKRYWSRPIDLNGEQWQVNVSAENAEDGMPIKVANPGPKLFGDLSSRSFNGYPAKVGTVYYDKSQGQDADGLFSMNGAHEIGHGVLTNAFGYGWSWGHEGTSGKVGKIHDDAPKYPVEGEISLMPHHNERSGVNAQDVLQRTIASQPDVKTLIYISGRH